MARGSDATLPPIFPSAAIREAYERVLDALIAAMDRDVARTLTRAYRDNSPKHLMIYAMDASPARTMRGAVSKLDRKWQRKFDDRATDIATKFARSTKARIERELSPAAKRLGVPFKMTPAMNDAFQAIVGENVSLIKSIPSQYMTQVETMVMQSVAAGRDLKTLTDNLEKRAGITRRRARTISRDQNNKATALLRRTRELEMGITQGTWLHSGGGKVPRDRHVAFSGRPFDLAKGHDFDDGEGPVLPGQPINCRCVWRSVIPGFED